eukprot:TRINITY_DN4945_c0_g2_i3.p1 TRINITY_DN4945_c0_g2~~TRINITY_DN4945_c0_g2_i3.p1  ORF type:complete len:934 (+),score=92.11 TRINITY_DN4945_c0_g2_i3:404-2803(+)
MAELAAAMGEWVRDAPGQVLAAGDLNPRRNSHLAPALYGQPSLRELVGGRPTYKRWHSCLRTGTRQLRTSPDCVFVDRRLAVGALQFHWGRWSDHAALSLALGAVRASPIPPMHKTRPPGLLAGAPSSVAAAVANVLLSPPANTPTRKHPSKTSARLAKALARRLQLRWTARTDGDTVRVRTLNAEITDIRSKIHAITNATYTDSACPPRAPYAPPSFAPAAAAAVVQALDTKLAADPVRGSGDDPMWPPAPAAAAPLVFSPADVTAAVERLQRKRGTRQADLGVAFLADLTAAETRGLASLFNDWVRRGIPCRYAVSWIYLILKPRCRGSPASLKAYRPVSIMTLLAKLFHVLVYEASKELLGGYVASHAFQVASVRPHAVFEVIGRVQAALDEDEADVARDPADPVSALMVDILSAYDTVDHDVLEERVRRVCPPPLADAIMVAVRSQGYAVATHEGFSHPMRMRRGLAQGSPLAVLLFLVLTAEAPPALRAQLAKVYVDDVTVVARLSEVRQAWIDVVGWLRGLKLDVAPTKVALVSSVPATIALPLPGAPDVVVKASPTARLLGGCLHATAASAEGCTRNEQMLDGYTTACDSFRLHKGLSTLQRVHLHNTVALPRLAVHAVSACFCRGGVTHPKFTALKTALCPPVDRSRLPTGVLPAAVASFQVCDKGYNLTSGVHLAHLAKARAYLAMHDGAPPVGPLPVPAFEVRALLQSRPTPCLRPSAPRSRSNSKRPLRTGRRWTSRRTEASTRALAKRRPVWWLAPSVSGRGCGGRRDPARRLKCSRRPSSTLPRVT